MSHYPQWPRPCQDPQSQTSYYLLGLCSSHTELWATAHAWHFLCAFTIREVGRCPFLPFPANSSASCKVQLMSCPSVYFDGTLFKLSNSIVIIRHLSFFLFLTCRNYLLVSINPLSWCLARRRHLGEVVWKDEWTTKIGVGFVQDDWFFLFIHSAHWFCSANFPEFSNSYRDCIHASWCGMAISDSSRVGEVGGM